MSFLSLLFEEINENLIVKKEMEAMEIIWRQDSINSPGGIRFGSF